MHIPRISIAILIVILLATGSIIVLKSMMSKPAKEGAAVISAAEVEDFENADFERDGKWYGLCEKNSVRTIDDFRRTVSKDQTLSVHYANFNWDKASMGKLQKPTLAYVFYKKDGKIFRKGKPITLPAGDQYITDGKTMVRAHCCNEFAAGDSVSEIDTPAGTESPAAPNMRVASSSPIHQSSAGQGGGSYQEASSGGSGGGSSGGGGGGGIVPFTPPITPHKPDTPDNPDKPKPVPEPAMALYFGIGLAAIFIIFLVKYSLRRRKNLKD